MEIGSNTLRENGELMNLDYEDEDFLEEQTGYEEPEEDPNGEDITPEPTLVERLLQDKGITDTSKIKFANEDNSIEERDWNSLSAEEQYNILSEQPSIPQQNISDQLSDEELSLLNYMRQNNLTPSEYINLSIQQGVQNYINNQPGPSYQVDDMTDEDLYMADLKLRTPDITDEELLSALDTAKSNEQLFAKQVAGLRQEYKELEDSNREEEQAISQEQAQEQYNQFAETIYDSIDSLSTLGDIDIELDDNDKADLAEYILGYDQAGVNHLQKALSDPRNLTAAAWFLLKGQETIDGLIQYFTKEISEVRKNSFIKGQESREGSPTVVVKQQPEQRRSSFTQGPINSIDDLD